MVAPIIAAAGISAVGSLLGGLFGGGGSKKAAQIQQQTAREAIAAQQRNQQYITGLEQPTIDRGNWAGSLYGNFLGQNGGSGAADALATYRGSTGYQDLVREGLGAINSNAYARGMGDSGATLKALQTRGASLADRSAGDYLGRLQGLIGAGQQAIGNVAGVATNTTNYINQANQGAADAQSNNALIQSANWQKALQGVFNAGSYALGSSYGNSGVNSGMTAPPWQTPGFGGPIQNVGGYTIPGGFNGRYA